MPTARSTLPLRNLILLNLKLARTVAPRFGIIVKGLPGGLKTRTTLETLISMHSVFTRAKIPIVIALPTRVLRDYCARMALERLTENDVVVFRSKSEICPTYREQVVDVYKALLRRVLQDVRYAEAKLGYSAIFGKNMIRMLAELYVRYKVCRECSSRANCEFYQNLRLLLANTPKLYFMTHKLLQILVHTSPLLFKRCIIVIDEVDQYIDVFRRVMTIEHAKVIEKLAKIDPIWNRILGTLRRQLILSRGTGILFVKPAMPRCLLPILISATVDIEDIDLAYAIAHRKKYIFDVYTVSTKIIDKCVVCHNLIYMLGETGENVVKPRDAAKKIAAIVAELVSSGLRVGIAARSYDFAELLTYELSPYGIKFFTDAKYRKQNLSIREIREQLRTVDVIIWTTRGKLSRGVSLPDCDVIICTYQAADLVKPSDHVIDYVVLGMYEEEIDDTTLRLFAHKICDAHNVQSFFRANRNREMKHVFLFADRRAWEAMIRTFREYAKRSRTFEKWYKQELLKPKRTDLRNTRHVVETVLSAVKT